MIHPCHLAQFDDNGGVSASPFEGSIETAPHSSPITETVTNFPLDTDGTYECGPQTIVIVSNESLDYGTLEDFISIGKDAETDLWAIKIAPINPLQGPNTYTLLL